MVWDGLSHRDVDATIAGLECLIAGFHERIRFAVRGDVDVARVEPGLDEEIANGPRAFQTQLEVARLRSHGVGMTNNHDVGDRSLLDRYDNVPQQGARGLGQLVRLESEVEGESFR